MNYINIIRWVLVLPVALLGSCAGFGIGFLLLQLPFHLGWLANNSTIPVFILSALPPILFLILGTITAPSRKIMTIYVLYTIGAIIAGFIFSYVYGVDVSWNRFSSMPYSNVFVSGLVCAGILLRIYRIKS